MNEDHASLGSVSRREFAAATIGMGLTASLPTNAAVGDEKPERKLRPLAFQPLPLGQIKPAGWLLNQLKIQAAGLGGHLDEFWPDVRDSAWIGGQTGGRGRGPPRLRGVFPP